MEAHKVKVIVVEFLHRPLEPFRYYECISDAEVSSRTPAIWELSRIKKDNELFYEPRTDWANDIGLLNRSLPLEDINTKGGIGQILNGIPSPMPNWRNDAWNDRPSRKLAAWVQHLIFVHNSVTKAARANTDNWHENCPRCRISCYTVRNMCLGD